jgi:hypothetical protein
MAGFHLPMAGWFYAQRDDARYPRFVTVFYPLHPFCGRGTLVVRQRCGAGGALQVQVELEQKLQAVPLWMTDEEGCARMTISFEPFCSLTSMLELRSLLWSLGL